MMATSDQAVAEALDETVQAIRVLDLNRLKNSRRKDLSPGAVQHCLGQGRHQRNAGKEASARPHSTELRGEPGFTQTPEWERYERPMGTLTSILDIAQQALMTDQFALNVTANNVANQNTPGYTREVVNFETEDSVSLSGGSQSSGVTATESSQRDRVLEQRVQQQTQAVAQSGALGSALQQVESIFGLNSTSSSANSSAVTSSALGSGHQRFILVPYLRWKAILPIRQRGKACSPLRRDSPAHSMMRPISCRSCRRVSINRSRATRRR